MPIGVARAVVTRVSAGGGGGGTPGSTDLIAASAGTAITDSGVVSWTTPGNITALDGARATAVWASTGVSRILYAQFSGLSAVPVGATPTGVIVRVHRDYSATLAQNVRDHTVRLTKDGTNMVGDNLADTSTNWPQAGGVNKDYGSASNLWNTTLTAAEVRAAAFGVMIKAQFLTGTASTSARIDVIWINVHYVV